MRPAIAAAVDYLFSRSDAAVGLDVEPPAALPRVVETAAYRIAAEALSNAAKHAGAQAVVVQVSQAGQDLVVRVVDDGRGLSDGGETAPHPGHIGLWGMRQRAASVGGTLVIASTSTGTSVTARLPLAPEEQVPADGRLVLAPDDAESLRAERDGLARAFELSRQRERAAGERAEQALAMARVDDASVVSGVVANGLADYCAVTAGSAVLESAAPGPGEPPGDRLIGDDWLELAGIVASTGTPMLVNGPASTATATGVDTYGVIVPVAGAGRPAALVAGRARSPFGHADVAFFAALARRVAAAAGTPG